MTTSVPVGDRIIGEGQSVYIIAEIGINHNGIMAITKDLISAAAHAGCDAVKFQKRTPEVCVPQSQRDRIRETPWGEMSYLEYRNRMEFGLDAYEEIDACCRENAITWFASVWDEEAVDFIEQFSPPCYKIASASATDLDLLNYVRQMGRPVILSTGMSTMEQIETAVEVLGTANLLIAHSTSTYPCPLEELNLRVITTLKKKFGCPIGYSGHEAGLPTTVAAVALGACFVERHITLDRTMWGSDQAASVEPHGVERLVKHIRAVEEALGSGEKEVYQSEMAVRDRLRRVD